MITDIQTHAPVAAISPQSTATEPKQFLTFLLGTETFAIGIPSIKEIIEYGSPTEVPLVPGFVRGVINLRGAVVPVVDLQTRFARPSGAITKRTCIVIVELDSGEQRQVIGVVVDAVNEVLDISPSEIEPPPAFGTRIRSEFLHGMGKVRGKFVILLDVNHVLSFEEISTLGTFDAPTNVDMANTAPAS